MPFLNVDELHGNAVVMTNAAEFSPIQMAKIAFDSSVIDQQTKHAPYTEPQLYLHEHAQDGSNGGIIFDLVEQEALHFWIKSQIKLITTTALTT